MIATRGVLLTLPSVLMVGLAGRYLLGLHFGLAACGVLVLSAYGMSGLGALIGFWSPTAQVASLATQILNTVIILFAPVYLPLERLPAFLRYTSMAFPTTYAARALRLAVGGAPLGALRTDLAMLAAFTAVSLVLVPMKVQWRQA